jgi:uncharacterized protein
MKVEGKYQFKAPREQVYATLTDPKRLQTCIPGCHRFEKVGEDQYEVTLEAGVASIKGTYTGTARMAEQDPPNRFKLIVEGKGSAGWVRGEGALSLEDNGNGTTVTVDGDANVGGLIASVGQRLIGGVAKKMVAQFFDCMESQVGGGASPGV